uniref:Uncharacterized protein n=1 Tax=Opuntia streptacantha TaxID=393608 RepID=A0A7C8Z2S3_OPUST
MSSMKSVYIFKMQCKSLEYPYDHVNGWSFKSRPFVSRAYFLIDILTILEISELMTSHCVKYSKGKRIQLPTDSSMLDDVSITKTPMILKKMNNVSFIRII